MKSAFAFVIVFYALLSTGNSSSEEDRRWLVSLVDLVELDYEDHCEQRADATWRELIGIENGLTLKLERDKAFGILARKEIADIKGALTKHVLASDDDVLRRKVQLLLKPGDMLLDTDQWIKLVTFGDTAIHKLRFAKNYYCGVNEHCSLKDLHKNMAVQQDEKILLKMKESWESNLPSVNEYLEQILPLLKNASQKNNYETLEDYWDSLVEYEGAIVKARELWDKIKPLYEKLHKYVTLKLRGRDAIGKPLPVHILRSLTGEDWTNVIDSLLPKHADIYHKIHTNLQEKAYGGINAFKQAAKVIQEINLGELDSRIWTDSLFNSSCPTTIVDWCKPNKIKAVTCSDISITNYVEAHEATMKMKFKQMAALHSNNTYILREANRYSAVYEAIPGFISLLALNPHALSQAGLYSIERFNVNPNHHRLVLQLITALRDLPTLNYYMAADEWRLQTLLGKFSNATNISSWHDFRNNFSLLYVSDADILGDPFVLLNKPFIGKFMGIILKYQIYQSYAEELMSDDFDLILHVSESYERLSDAMIQGYGVMWPDLISDLLAKRENSLDYTAITDYYTLLDEFLDKQLDPSPENEEIDDYVEPVESSPEENVIYQETPIENIATETHEEIVENVIDLSDRDNIKYNSETSTVGVLEIKNPVLSDRNDISTKEASYNTYWWIGIAVAVAVVVIIIVIIARKRKNHRKQLEKQRRETSRA